MRVTKDWRAPATEGASISYTLVAFSACSVREPEVLRVSMAWMDRRQSASSPASIPTAVTTTRLLVSDFSRQLGSRANPTASASAKTQTFIFPTLFFA